METLKKAYAWQEALELSKQLVAVCEEFRDPEANVLVYHLRGAMVDIPAGIAADLQANRTADMGAMVKLATVLELVRRVYPAIETASADQRFEQLWKRMGGDKFGEREPEPIEEEEAASPGVVVASADTAASPEDKK